MSKPQSFQRYLECLDKIDKLETKIENIKSTKYPGSKNKKQAQLTNCRQQLIKIVESEDCSNWDLQKVVRYYLRYPRDPLRKKNTLRNVYHMFYIPLIDEDNYDMSDDEDSEEEESNSENNRTKKDNNRIDETYFSFPPLTHAISKVTGEYTFIGFIICLDGNVNNYLYLSDRQVGNTLANITDFVNSEIESLGIRVSGYRVDGHDMLKNEEEKGRKHVVVLLGEMIERIKQQRICTTDCIYTVTQLAYVLVDIIKSFLIL